MLEFSSGQEFCRKCGKEIDKTSACPYCGSVSPGIAMNKGKERISAALLAIFLGTFGIHKFYLGKTGQGILYLLFCWTLIPGFIAFIEGIIYLCSSDENFARKYDHNR